MYPFGHGLSYTQFKVEWSQTEKQQILYNMDDSSSVSYDVKVTNVGKLAGTYNTHHRIFELKLTTKLQEMK